MEIEKIKPGMLAWSRAGHDKGNLYMILRVADDCVFLADGKQRTVENPKKKKIKHVQLMYHIPRELKTVDINHIKNEEIKYALKCHLKSELCSGG